MSTAGDRPIATTSGVGTTGSSETASAPSLPHSIGTTTTLAKGRRGLDGQPEQKKSGSTVVEGCQASRRTVGWAQAPPNHPRIVPSARRAPWNPAV